VPPEHGSPATWQVVPQQTCPVPPHAVHIPRAQTVPLLRQSVPPQHGWPGPPHAAHLPSMSHVAPTSQVVPQQGCPTAPQPAHMPAEQVNAVAQAEPVQHSWLPPPQVTQLPSLPHRWPAAQVEPAQQGWRAPPQSPHVPDSEQATPAAMQRRPPQQSIPSSPHAVQRPSAQTVSPVQASSAQQG
jgi:hypothetical protein